MYVSFVQHTSNYHCLLPHDTLLVGMVPVTLIHKEHFQLSVSESHMTHHCHNFTLHTSYQCYNFKLPITNCHSITDAALILVVVEKWNDLEVVEAGSIHSFKSRYIRAYEAKRELI
ncbi:hypothetical protein OTU49_008535 [Cherax quadricarinatus]|uniref:Uncharacterized protein n=1 Tax=Cherax quadricarinatus TaxID=27406 RepID=A0AAW0WEV1_CHEQU